MTMATVNGVELYYERTGRGPRLVLTHGAFGSADTWRAVVEPLASDFEVVTWDRRGHTRSTDGDGPGSRHQDAADLAGLIRHLGPDPAHVHGNSSGGTVVLTLVAEHPEVVASASVHEPAVMGLLAESPDPDVVAAVAADLRGIASFRELMELGEVEGATRAFVELAIGPGAWDRYPDEVRGAFVANASTFFDESRSPMEMWTAEPDVLVDNEVPMLLTHGTTSPRLEIIGTQELMRRLPSARSQVMQGTGHVPYRTDPEMWIESVGGFVASQLVAVGG